MGGLLQLVNMRVRLSDTQLLRMGLYYTKKGDAEGKWLDEGLALLDSNITRAEVCFPLCCLFYFFYFKCVCVLG